MFKGAVPSGDIDFLRWAKGGLQQDGAACGSISPHPNKISLDSYPSLLKAIISEITIHTNAIDMPGEFACHTKKGRSESPLFMKTPHINLQNCPRAYIHFAVLYILPPILYSLILSFLLPCSRMPFQFIYTTKMARVPKKKNI
jgi:hypothetical protein